MRATRSQEAVPKTVSATAIGQYAFCPESWRLSAGGARPNDRARERMKAGVSAHEQWQRQEDRGYRFGSLLAWILGLIALLALVWALVGAM